MADREKYENDLHNATNPRLADMLDEVADRMLSALFEKDSIEVTLLRESAKRLRIKQRELFNHETFSV